MGTNDHKGSQHDPYEGDRTLPEIIDDGRKETRELLPSGTGEGDKTEYLIVRGHHQSRDGRETLALRETRITTSGGLAPFDDSQFHQPEDARQRWGRVHDLGWTPRPTPQPTPKGDDDGLTLEDVVEKFRSAWMFTRRYWPAMLLTMVLGGSLGALTYLWRPPPNEAMFRIQLMPEANENPVEPHRPRNLEFFAEAQRNFLNPDLVGKTLTSLQDERPSRKEISAVQSRLSFQQVGEQTYEGRYERRADADQVVSFLDRHLDQYLDSEIEKAIRSISSRVDFLKKELSNQEDKLRETEQELLAFKRDHIQGLPTQAETHLDTLVEVSQRERDLRAELERIGLELGHQRKRLRSDGPVRRSRAQAAQPYRAQLVDLQRQLQAAKASGKGDEHPDVVALQGQLTGVERRMNEAMKQGDPIADEGARSMYGTMRQQVEQLEVARAVAQRELGQLKKERERLEGVVEDLPALEAEFATLTRSYEASKDHHRRLFENLKSLQLQLELEKASASARYEILEHPSAIAASRWKSLALRIGIGAVTGFLLGILFGMLRDVFLRARSYWRATAVPAISTGQGTPAPQR